MLRTLSWLMVALGLAGAGPALAAPPDNLSPRKSHFTTLDLKTCRKVVMPRGGDVFQCSGFAGIPVLIGGGERRVFMSFGANAERARAARQTLGVFNSVFEDGRSRATIEWRTERRGGVERPYAAIVRYFTSNGRAKGQVLVVTRLSDTSVCHLAYIDALANAEPVALARSAADELGPGFDCRSEPRVIGVKGRSPM